MNDKNLKIILTGRYASGQKSFCKKLKEKGFVIENYHDPENNLETNFENTDIIVIKPDLVKDFTNKHQATAFRLIYMNSDYYQRVAQFDAETDKSDIEEIDAEENDLFYDYFEQDFRSNKLDIKNVSYVAEIHHDFDNDNALYEWVDFIINENKMHDNATVIIEDLCKRGALDKDDDGKIRVSMNNDDGTTYDEYMSVSMFVETTLQSDEGLALMTREWLKHIDL